MNLGEEVCQHKQLNVKTHNDIIEMENIATKLFTDQTAASQPKPAKEMSILLLSMCMMTRPFYLYLSKPAHKKIFCM